MSKDYYVILTGGKNNAGDFLIKYRAFKLFETLRADRNIIDYNEWEAIDDEKLKVINSSKALILLGGPGVLPYMYPNIYPLRENLEDIKVPIVMMGLGWKDAQGDWINTYKIKFSEKTKQLLNKINNSGYFSSVRDYHTLNTLQINGYKNILMTGCPAYYDLDFIDKGFEPPKNIKRVAFSLGVSFVQSAVMEQQMKEVILILKDKFRKEQFQVVFHHSISKEKLNTAYKNSSDKHFLKHSEFTNWLEMNSVEYVDISGSANNLIKYYSNIDLHIGYRVHAHIFMNSISKYSVLISEDGRAKAVRDVIQGLVINGYVGRRDRFMDRVIHKIISRYDRFLVNEYLINELVNNLEYEEKIYFNRIKNSRKSIDNNFNIMKQFIKQLP